MVNKVAFIGSKHLGIQALKKIYNICPRNLCAIITIDDSKDVRCKLDEFTDFSEHTGKNVFILKKPAELYSVIDQTMPDLCIVVGWYWIIKPDLLNKVPHGILGIHASLLPEYRGSAPLIWPIINGDKKSGVTLFYFDEGLDTGDIVGQKEFKIDDNDSVTEIMKKAEALIEQLLEEYYPLLLESKAPRFKQDHSKATYCSRRTPEDGCINWNLTNVEIHNLIRAQTHPYPGAFCSYGENRLYLWKSSLFRQPYHGIPGMVTQTMGDKVVIACGKGAVILHEVQLENSTSKAAGDILKYGTRLK